MHAERLSPDSIPDSNTVKTMGPPVLAGRDDFVYCTMIRINNIPAGDQLVFANAVCLEVYVVVVYIVVIIGHELASIRGMERHVTKVGFDEDAEATKL